MSVKVSSDGSIEIDNTELLAGRADTSDEPGEPKLQSEDLGGMPEKEEKKLKTDEKKLNWHEPSRKDTDVNHVCPVCGTRYWGRTNRNYCTKRCKEVAKKRRMRKRKRDIRDFKPHRGTAGEVYFMTNVDGKEVVSFVPAFNAETREKAKEFLDKEHPKDVVDDIAQQVNEVIKK